MLFEFQWPLWRSLLCLVIIMALPLAVVQAKPVPIPPWATSMLTNPPKVPPEIVSEVDDLWAVMREHSRERESRPFPDAEYVRAATRFIALKEQASQAMIWQYFKEPPIKMPSNISLDNHDLQVLALSKGDFRVPLLRVLYDDPDLARWFLPLFRDRMRWVENEIRHGKFLESIGHSELAAIQLYLYTHGEMTDIESFERMLTKAENAGIYKRRGGFEATMDKQMPYIRKAKAGLRLHAQPFWQRIALELAQYGWFDKKTLDKPHYTFPEIDSRILNPASQASQGWRAKDSKTQTIASQVILVGLALLAVLLLALMLKKRSDAV